MSLPALHWARSAGFDDQWTFNVYLEELLTANPNASSTGHSPNECAHYGDLTFFILPPDLFMVCVGGRVLLRRPFNRSATVWGGAPPLPMASHAAGQLIGGCLGTH